MTGPAVHPSWCAQPHHSTLHASEPFMVVEQPVTVYVHVERDDDGAAAVVVLEAIVDHARFDVPMSLVDADTLRAKLAELVTVAVMP